MKKYLLTNQTSAVLGIFLGIIVGLPATVRAQYDYTTNNGTITITGYPGPSGAVTIPAIITGLPVTSIGDSAFLNNSFVTSVTIPNSITNIGIGAFSGCTSLSAITVDALNPAYISVGGVVFNKSQTVLIQYPAGKAGSQYTIPNSVTSIGGGAFFKCYNLANVTIPNSVISIGGRAFIGCTNLTNVTIGNSVTSVEPYAFAECISLTNVTIGDSVTGIGYGAFVGCTSLTTITIPNSVTGIGQFAFESCYALSSVTIGNSVVSIGDEAFDGCTSLTSVTIPDSVTSIGGAAFGGCTSLTNVKIGNSVTSIGGASFASCTSLTTITIPNSVTDIGDYAFEGCTSLASVDFQGNAPSLGGSSVFSSAVKATAFYLPGTTGWGATFGGRPIALWVFPNPLILSFGSNFGVQTNRFGFIISWATNIPVMVEASTTLVNPVWSPISTNTLTGGSSYFSDPARTNYPSRFYRLRSP